MESHCTLEPILGSIYMSILDFGKKSDEKPMDLEYRQIPDGVGVLTWFEMETERI